MIKLICFIAATIAVSSPPPRWAHGMCYDTETKSILMFGGSGTDGLYGDLWSLSKGQWKKLSGTGPSPRHKFAFAYDEKRKRAVLFGGSGANDELFGDTWEWNGSSWKKIDVRGPVPRDHPMAAFDRQSNTIILKGGFSQAGLHTDSWSFDGAKWTELKSAGPAGEGLAHGMFIDESTQQLTEITVEMNNKEKQEHLTNTWWVLDNKTWQSAGKKFPSTSLQSIQAMSSFGKGGILVLDGDNVENGTPTTSWLSNGKWKTEHLEGPAPRVGHCMAWDPTEGAAILFGGFDRKTFFSDTWMWKNEKWVRVGK